MDNEQHENALWVERVKSLIMLLEGSTISEMELAEGGTEIIIRRQPGMMMVPMQQQVGAVQVQMGTDGMPLPAVMSAPAVHAKKEDRTVPVPAPLTGVFYAAPSPSSPPFVNVGEVIHAGQVIALIEAMKVFNEIQAEVSGRVTALLATSGDVVQKGDALMQVEPL